MALDILGPGNFVVTTLEDRSVAAIKTRFPAVPAALSLGRDLSDVPRAQQGGDPAERALPDAQAPGLPRRLGGGAPPAGRGGVLARCHRAGVKTMIWTVDEDAEIRRWLADPRVTVLITNRPGDAVAMRSSRG